MALDPSIILSGRQPNLVNALAGGLQTGQMQNDIRYQGEYRNALSQYGAGAMNGDQTAMNALAGFDPQMTLGLSQTRLGMDLARREDRRADTRLEMDAERLTLAREEGRRAAQAFAFDMSQAERAQAAEAIEGAVASGLTAGSPQEWDAIVGDQVGPDGRPLAGRFAEREAIAAQFLGVADVLAMQTPEEPPAAAQTLAWRAEQAGLQPGTPEYQAFMAAGGEPETGMTLRDPVTGNVIYETRTGGTDDRPPQANPSSPESMISTIDGILDDPALDFATGWLAWTQNIPGTPARRFGARANQLEGQAFLQAFESLKGGGQITEVEGQKATQAIGRLDTAQAPEDYRDALMELRSLLELAQSRPPGWASQQGGSTATQPQQQAQPTQGGIPPLPSGVDIRPEEWPQIWQNMPEADRALFQ